MKPVSLISIARTAQGKEMTERLKIMNKKQCKYCCYNNNLARGTATGMRSLCGLYRLCAQNAMQPYITHADRCNHFEDTAILNTRCFGQWRQCSDIIVKWVNMHGFLNCVHSCLLNRCINNSAAGNC